MVLALPERVPALYIEALLKQLGKKRFLLSEHTRFDLLANLGSPVQRTGELNLRWQISPLNWRSGSRLGELLSNWPKGDVRKIAVARPSVLARWSKHPHAQQSTSVFICDGWDTHLEKFEALKSELFVAT